MRAGIGFLAGLGVGVAVGIMVAPQSGSETQRFIKQRAGDSLDRAAATARDLRKQAGDVAEDAMGRARQAVDQAKEAYHERT